ncbi:podocalyxin-like protein 2 [Sceloporus undulatus]|uniref:podocalyxin-like protein 2 n=1 Tax=Sceloporus undulatus TaxID=8520 RepID=UPI001C4BE892|nr:podocalyxin-like protein 2 [Sceloporus undulatus]
MKAWLPQALGCLLAWGSLCICLPVLEDSGTEGLSSTSLVDFRAISQLESLDSSEQTNLEVSELVPSALQASPGSGFSSEENEDSKVLQSQFFWEDGGDINDSSLYVGPASDYSFPLASQKALPKGNGTQIKDPQEVPTFRQSLDSIEPDSEVPSTGALEEEEGLLPINQSKGVSQSSQIPKVSFSETPGQDASHSMLFSTTASTTGLVTEVPVDRQEDESAPEHASSGLDLGSSMGPSVLPLSSILSATPKEAQLVSDIPLRITSENQRATVGGEHMKTITTTAAMPSNVREVETSMSGDSPKPTKGTGMGHADSAAGTVAIEATEEAETKKQTGGDLLITQSHGDGTQVSETASRTSSSPSNPSSSVDFWDWTDKPAPTPTPNQNMTKLPVTATAAGERSFAPQTGDARMAVLSTGVPWSLTQVTCKDWSNLAGKNYIILNMSDNIDCEEFRVERGLQLLALVEDAFSRFENGLQGQWLISLSKPNENDKHLLMTLAGEHGVVPTNDVLLALGDMRRSLAEIGIQNYTTTSSCQSRPSQTHSDYGKLFVVLVIIGSICVIIIIMGLIYNCWQRRLPKMKNMSHGEELRFVENGCHDNPTLDVASDNQSEMQEKKPSVNGGGAVNGPESWDVLINKRPGEEGDVFEEDTHL